MITFTIDNPEQVQEFIRSRGERVMVQVRSEMARQMIALQANVVGSKLSGQVLKNRTGTLRRAIGEKVESEATAVQGSVFADPSVPYAKIHEYGGQIRIPEVSGKLMVFEKDGKTIFTRSHKAFTVDMPERSFMRTALAERRAEIIAGLRGALDRGLAK